MSRHFKRLYLYLVLLFLYAPILTLMVYSFNASRTRANWGGFSLDWYRQLFADPEILRALYVTIALAVLSALIATVIGTIAAIGIHSLPMLPRAIFINVSYLPMVSPDIVTAISMMILFLAMMPKGGSLGFGTMLLAHIAFNVPYVLFSVLPKLKQMNTHSYEAALDLGATPTQALFKIVLPEILPGVFTGMLLAFTLSLDDFVISFFTGGSVQNLSALIYSMARRGINPKINALSTLMFVFVITLLLIVNKRSSLANRND